MSSKKFFEKKFDICGKLCDVMGMNETTITTADLIEAKVYKNEKVYELAKQLLEISSDMRAIISTAKVLPSQSVSSDLLSHWMQSIDSQIQETLRAEVL